jgi:predicted alpha/beta hydrolase
MDVRTLEIRAADGFMLAGTLYDAGSRDALVLASAMGVKRRFYDAFARHAAERGRSVVTFDYRGIGDSRPRSLRGFEATLAEWGRLDVAAAIDWITRELAPGSLTYLGHSAGGQISGLAANADRVGRFVFVASQSGYWRYWPGLRAYGLGALWLAMPVISRAAGYFPAKALLFGSEDLPRGVASQWAQWGRHPEYVWGYHDPALYARITAPVSAWSLHRDHYAPRPAVDAFAAHFTGAPMTRVHVDEPIGHFEIFRRGHEAWWDRLLRRDPDTPL